MNFRIKVSSLLMSNCLPAGERMVAECLAHNPGCDAFLESAQLADVILVTSGSFPEELRQKLLTQTAVKLCWFPAPILEIMSLSPTETSKHSSLTVCSLLKKIYQRHALNLKGVLAVYLGISVNGLSAPGPMIWKLKGSDFIRFIVSSLNLVLSMSFVDSFTMMPKLRSIVYPGAVEAGVRTPSQLITEALTLLRTDEDNSPNVNQMLQLANAIVPAAYHSRRASTSVNLLNSPSLRRGSSEYMRRESSE